MDGNDSGRTYHASQAVHMSDLLNLRFAKERFGTDRPRYLRVREPDGPSTAGGRKARQALTLVDFQDEKKSALVCGFVDTVARKAELRGYPMVKQAFEQRFNLPIDISRGEYGRMMSMLQDFMAGQGIETRLLNDPPPRAAPATPTPPRRPAQPTTAVIHDEPTTPAWAWAALGFTLGFVCCYALFRTGYL